MSSFFGEPDIIICDDGGIEVADFLLCYTGIPKVVQIHAKASSSTNQSSCSASKLHDICSQAAKNLGILAMYNNIKPQNLQSWKGPWVAKVSGGIGRVSNRIIKGPADCRPVDLWKRIRECINNPQVDKEVWLVLGNIMSLRYFETELSHENPPSNVVQAAYLLESTMTSVASVGAKLRIICAE